MNTTTYSTTIGRCKIPPNDNSSHCNCAERPNQLTGVETQFYCEFYRNQRNTAGEKVMYSFEYYRNARIRIDNQAKNKLRG